MHQDVHSIGRFCDNTALSFISLKSRTTIDIAGSVSVELLTLFVIVCQTFEYLTQTSSI